MNLAVTPPDATSKDWRTSKFDPTNDNQLWRQDSDGRIINKANGKVFVWDKYGTRFKTNSGFKWSFNRCVRSSQEPSGQIGQKFQAKYGSENRCMNTANRFDRRGSILMLYPCGRIHPVNGCFKFKEVIGPKPTCTCGESHQAQRVVGGTETEVNEYPWQVGLVRPGRRRPFCGGSIISNRHILTAAHCTQSSPSSIRVLLGEHDTTDSVADIRTISAITNHPSYNPSIVVNDISILTLSSPITFSSIMSPVCLPSGTSEKFAGDLATVTGWGFTFPGRNPSETLQDVDITVATNEDCSNIWSAGRWPIRDTNICAGDPRKSACNGDSGGPLFLAENGRFSQIGVVSWGPSNCGVPGFLGVYSRVSEYKDWIKSVATGTQDSNC